MDLARAVRWEENAGPAGPFLAPSCLLPPCGTQISSWCDPCPCSQICLPLPVRPSAFATPRLTSAFLRQRTKMSFSLSPPSPSQINLVFSCPHLTSWESGDLAFSSSFVINSLYDFGQVLPKLFLSILQLGKVGLDL